MQELDWVRSSQPRHLHINKATSNTFIWVVDASTCVDIYYHLYVCSPCWYTFLICLQSRQRICCRSCNWPTSYTNIVAPDEWRCRAMIAGQLTVGCLSQTRATSCETGVTQGASCRPTCIPHRTRKWHISIAWISEDSCTHVSVRPPSATRLPRQEAVPAPFFVTVLDCLRFDRQCRKIMQDDKLCCFETTVSSIKYKKIKHTCLTSNV